MWPPCSATNSNRAKSRLPASHTAFIVPRAWPCASSRARSRKSSSLSFPRIDRPLAKAVNRRLGRIALAAHVADRPRVRQQDAFGSLGIGVFQAVITLVRLAVRMLRSALLEDEP